MTKKKQKKTFYTLHKSVFILGKLLVDGVNLNKIKANNESIIKYSCLKADEVD